MRLLYPLLASLLLAAPPASAAPPSLDIPPTVHPEGQYVRFVPKTDAVSVVYVPLDGVEPFPGEFLKDPRAFVLDKSALVPGRAYRFTAVGAGKGGEQTRKDFVVVSGPPGTTPPPVDPPAKDPPPDLPPPGPGKLYFAVVRPDGPAGPAFTKVMQDPAWAQLRIQDHLVKDFTESDAVRMKLVPDRSVQITPLPAVVTLRVAPDGKTSTVVRPAVPLPTTAAGILDLPRIN